MSGFEYFAGAIIAMVAILTYRAVRAGLKEEAKLRRKGD